MANIKYVNFIKGSQNAKQPAKKYDGDAGWDLFASSGVMIPAGESRNVHTDVFCEFPSFIYGRITGRSSTLHTHNLLVNEAIIDNGYTGELYICVKNLGNEPFHVKQGMRLAQILFHQILDVRWCEVDNIDESSDGRGWNGFGSTGEGELK